MMIIATATMAATSPALPRVSTQSFTAKTVAICLLLSLLNGLMMDIAVRRRLRRQNFSLSSGAASAGQQIVF